MKNILLPVLAMAFYCTQSQAQKIPLVYNVENTAATFPAPTMPSIDKLPKKCALPDPLRFSDGSGRARKFKDWKKRRGEIACEIQHYEVGEKPVVNMDNIDAFMNGDTLTVKTTVNGKSIIQTAVIIYPSGGKAPYPLMIGADQISLPRELITGRHIAYMNFSSKQVNGYSQFRAVGSRGTYPFDSLYPALVNNGAYSEWAWGFSRLLDGLQKLGSAVTKIDMKHIGVTGCSYAGKMALFCGAFDERVALTIAQEPGGGGAAAWRVSHTLEGVEDLEHTDYNWFLTSMKEKFSGDNVNRLPHDRHELCAMVFPRALSSSATLIINGLQMHQATFLKMPR